jgi:hypothetical protein
MGNVEFFEDFYKNFKKHPPKDGNFINNFVCVGEFFNHLII